MTSQARKHTARVEARGHIIDSGLMSRCLAAVLEGGGKYQIVRFDPGRTSSDHSIAELEVEHETAEGLKHILENLATLGARTAVAGDVVVNPAPRNGVAPNGFYSSTNQPTFARIDGEWIRAERQRMDAVLVVEGRRVTCKKLRDLKEGERVVCGPSGIRIEPEFEARKSSDFVFMGDQVSSERVVNVRVQQIAQWAREARENGDDIVVVAGPVVVHTGGSEHLEQLIRDGWVDALLAGNALAVHDCERVLYGTSLGVDLETGIPRAEGHMHHMRAINAIRAAGSLKDAVGQGLLSRGIFHACIQTGTRFVLAGSIRDDGPIPDTLMDLVEAQDQYASALENAGLVLILATMLHGIGVGNMLPASVRTVCVDIHAAVVTKLNDRGSSQAIGLVTDVGYFLQQLVSKL